MNRLEIGNRMVEKHETLAKKHWMEHYNKVINESNDRLDYLIKYHALWFSAFPSYTPNTEEIIKVCGRVMEYVDFYIEEPSLWNLRILLQLKKQLKEG